MGKYFGCEKIKKLEMSFKTSVPYEHAEHPACIQMFVFVAAHTHTHTLQNPPGLEIILLMCFSVGERLNNSSAIECLSFYLYVCS